MFKLYTEDLVNSLAKSIENFDTKAKETDYIIKDIVISTNDTDRHQEVVLQEGIDFTHFSKNPIALIDHSYEVRSIVGSWFNIRQDGGQTIADCRIVETEAGNLIKKLHEAGIIKDVSIGFIAKERTGNVITKAELIECSFVVIGSNRGAKIKEFLGVEYKELVDAGVLIEEVPQVAETPETPEPTELEEVKAEIAEIKSLLTKLLDDKSKITEALEQKEQIQAIARIANEVLRDFKRA